MKKIIFFFTIVVFLTSCTDILLEEPQTILTPSGFYKTKNGMESLVKSCYSYMKEITCGGPSANNLKIMEVGTDIFTDAGTGVPYDDYTITASRNEIKGLWDNSYKAINACNYVTTFIDDVEDMDEARKKVVLAEARFLRAFYYYQLVMHFGPVHLSLDATVGVETEANRTPEDQIFDAIKADLEYAVENLPGKQSNYGRIDLYGAKHFFSKVLMSDKRSGTTEFQKAADLATSVINESGYGLVASRFDVHNENNPKNKEIIWSVQIPEDEALATGGNQIHLHFLSRYELNVPGITRSTEYGRPFRVLRPTKFMLDLYDEKIDTRYSAYWKDTWISNINAPNNGIFVGDTALHYPKYAWSKEKILSKKYLIFNPEFSENFGGNFKRVNGTYYPSLIKFIDTKRPSMNEMRGTRDWIVFRLAETYLLASEAYVRLNDKTKAAQYMNVLRKASAYPGKESDMEVTPAQMTMDFVLDESAREMCGEMWRWIDLKRTGKLIERVSAHNQFAKNMKPEHLLRPIPQSQIDRTSNEYPQNPGYN
jgi:starch-binding outer membrane protein, SusD/RagB family